MNNCVPIIFVVYLAGISVIFGQVPDGVALKSDNQDYWTKIWRIIDAQQQKTEDRFRKESRFSTRYPFPPDDSCNEFNPVKPTSAPGRRISEEKCEEYEWLIQFEQEKSTRTQQCTNVYGVLGGEPTFLGDYPHMGAIGWQTVRSDYIFKCGSTLISPKFVLTAAHCSRTSSLDETVADPVPKIIRLNDVHIEKDKDFRISTDVKIKQIIVHPKYMSPKKYFDIALMELAHSVPIGVLVRPACLWTKPEESNLEGVEAVITGWGVMIKIGSPGQLSPLLQAADINFINSSYCDRLLRSSRNRNWRGLQEHQLCAGKLEGGVDACQGDSGGPLQVRRPIATSIEGLNNSVHFVVGVTAFGILCGLPNTPSVYTRVSSFLDWIEGHVWPHA